MIQNTLASQGYMKQSQTLTQITSIDNNEVKTEINGEE